MSPTQFHDHHHHHAKTGNNNLLCPPALKINKDSHVISKCSSTSPPSSSSTSSLRVAGPAKTPQRHPVIIYTHSPKIIHAHPRDFMSLVQKLTGLSQSEDDDHTLRLKHKQGIRVAEDDNKNLKMAGIENDDNESSSVTTDENCGSIGEGQVNSCFMPPIFEPNNPNFITNIPVFTPNSAHFLCTNQPFYNYTNSLYFPPPPLPPPNLRISVSSSSSLEGMMNEFRDY